MSVDGDISWKAGLEIRRASREKIIKALEVCLSGGLPGRCIDCPYHGMACSHDCMRDTLKLLRNEDTQMGHMVQIIEESAKQIKAQQEAIGKLYSLLEETCKEFRRSTGDDDVCGLCLYNGCAHKGVEDWSGWCPGFDSDECFVMNNEIRGLAGKELLPDPAGEPAQIEIEGDKNTWWYVCGECHGAIDRDDKVCKHCGSPLIP